MTLPNPPKHAVPALLSGSSLIAQLAHADGIDDFVQNEMRRQHIPGVSIGIFRNGDIIRAQGYGLANLEHQVPVRPETVFQTASIGKMFTATAVLLLVDEGKLSLDAPLSTWLPQAPDSWRSITLRHLLNHTSGIGSPELRFDQEYTEQQLLEEILASPARYRPGQHYAYNNTGYVLAGIIVGKLAGKHYSQLLQERVFGPAGMKQARLISQRAIVPHRAAGYERENGQYCHQHWVSESLNTTGDGSLQMSVLDFAGWDRIIARRSLLSDTSWRQMLKPAPLNDGTSFPYGMGWELGSEDLVSVDTASSADRDDKPESSLSESTEWIGHGGSWQGFRSSYLRNDRDGLSFVVLANVSHADTDSILHGVAVRFESRYRMTEQRPGTDRHKPLTDSLNKLLDLARRYKDGAIEQQAAQLLSPGMTENESRDLLGHLQSSMRDAGGCASPVFYRDQPNGDLLMRHYRLQCAHETLGVTASFDETGRIDDVHLYKRQN